MSTRQHPERPVRVLHVLGLLSRGGIETCLLSLLRTLPPERFQTVVAWHYGDGRGMPDELRALGATPWRLLPPKSPLAHLLSLRRLFNELGPFEVIHTHVSFAGLLILAARLAGIPVRVAHSHMQAALMPPGALARAIVRLTNALFLPAATHRLGVSDGAAQALFGRRWQGSATVQLLPCGIDLVPFRAPAKASRKGLGLPDDALVIAQVGRFAPEKNHAFLLSVMKDILTLDPRARLLLIGEGPLEERLKEQAAGLGIADEVVFAGFRDDVPDLLMAVANTLALPSLSEGLPLVVLEAQAAGIPSVVSLAVPACVAVWPGLVRRLSISDPPRAWAAAILEASRQPRADRHALLSALAQTPYDFQYTATFLGEIYRSARRRAGA